MIEQKMMTNNNWEGSLGQPDLKPFPGAKISQYKKDSEDPGLWVHHDAEFLHTEYIIPKIKIPHPNRQSLKTILPAIDGSFVCHLYDGNIKMFKQCIVHISAEGDVLKQLNMDGDLISLVGMLEPDLVLVISNSEYRCKIVQWNLWTYEKIILTYPRIIFYEGNLFSFQRQAAKLGKVIIFGQTKMFCCCWSTDDQNRIRLAYFNYPLKSSQDRPRFVTSITLPSDYRNFRFVKLNNKSMVGWVPAFSQWKESIPIVIYQLSENEDKNLGSYTPFAPKTLMGRAFYYPKKIIQFVGGQYPIVSDIWQVRPGVIFIQLSFLETNRANNPYMVKKQQNLIWNCKQGTYRKPNFDIKQKHYIQILGNFRKINQIRLNQPISLLHFTTVEEEYPIYYVDMLTEQVLAIEKQNKQERKRYSYLNYDPQLQYCFIDAEEQKNHRKIVRVREVNWPNKIRTNLIVAFFLENLIDKCDQDLIHEASKLVEPDQGKSRVPGFLISS